MEILESAIEESAVSGGELTSMINMGSEMTKKLKEFSELILQHKAEVLNLG